MDKVERLLIPDSGELRIGVIADTHVPDRTANLHPGVIPTFMQYKVDIIFHAGDICDARVEEELSKVAPVRAVLGNRDWLFGRKLPQLYRFEVDGLQGALMHGQGSFMDYWSDKVLYTLTGYQFDRYRDVMHRIVPEADLIIFGHTHRAVNKKYGERLYFNPGCASSPKFQHGPSIGIITIGKEQQIQGEIITLQGAVLKKRIWKTQK